MSLLEAEALTKAYAEDSGVFDFSLRLAPGVRHGLTGPSGSGKSTLAALLSGYQRPDRGQVRVKGQSLRMGRGPLPVQLVPQSPATVLDPRMTMHQCLRSFVGTHALQAELERFGLDENVLDRRRDELSGGQQLRMVLIRALAVKPDVLVLDEPDRGLDRRSLQRLSGALDGWMASGDRAMVIVSHDLSFLMRLCTEFSVIDRGHVVDRSSVASFNEADLHPVTRAMVDAARRLYGPRALVP